MINHKMIKTQKVNQQCKNAVGETFTRQGQKKINIDKSSMFIIDAKITEVFTVHGS